MGDHGSGLGDETTWRAYMINLPSTSQHTSPPSTSGYFRILRGTSRYFRIRRNKFGVLFFLQAMLFDTFFKKYSIPKSMEESILCDREPIPCIESIGVWGTGLAQTRPKIRLFFFGGDQLVPWSPFLSCVLLSEQRLLKKLSCSPRTPSQLQKRLTTTVPAFNFAGLS